MALAQRAAHVETVPARQHAIEQDHVERLAAGALQACVTVDGRHDLVPFGRQTVGERHHEAGFVFDEKDTGHSGYALRVTSYE